MQITYKSRKLEKRLTDPKEISKSFGQLARKVTQRLKDLASAEKLETMRNLPSARCHELSGDLKGKLAVDISGNYRIIFETTDVPIPQKNDGGLNWEEVTKIQINEIEDYH